MAKFSPNIAGILEALSSLTITVPDLMPTVGTNIYSVLSNSSGANIKSSSGFLLSIISCINFASSTRYLQFFDKITTPATNDVPSYGLSIPVFANGHLMLGQDILGGSGIAFYNGISWGFSITPNVYTATSATDINLSVRYT